MPDSGFARMLGKIIFDFVFTRSGSRVVWTFVVVLLVVHWCCFEPASALGQTNSQPKSLFDLQQYIDSQIQSGNRRIVLSPGVYRVKPKDRQHLVLHDLKDVEIVANGVKMICTETTRALTLTRCTNVSIVGMVVDYDPLPFTQGRIVALSDDKKVHEIQLFNGYPDADSARKFKYEIFQPDIRTLRCNDRYPSKIDVLGPRRIRLFIPGVGTNAPERVGDLVVIGAEYAPHGSMAHAVECDHCVGVQLEDIKLYASNNFGFMEYGCSGTVYNRCRIERRLPNEDFERREDPRLRSLNADAFHSNGALKGPSYVECTAKFMGDDGINIHGVYHMVVSSESNQLRVLAKGMLSDVEGGMDIQPGDPVELVDFDGRRLPDSRVVSIRAAGAVTKEEQAFISRLNMNPNLKSTNGSLTKAYTIILATNVNISRGGVIGAANRVGSGFSVRNCDFGFNRSRGILIKASNGEIVGNRIEGSRMSAILVSPEYWWLESGSSSHLKISGNSITSCLGIPICVEAVAGNGRIAPAGAHADINIVGNSIKNCFAPGILVTSTEELFISNNDISTLAAPASLPALMSQAGLKSLQPVVEINCASKIN